MFYITCVYLYILIQFFIFKILNFKYIVISKYFEIMSPYLFTQHVFLENPIRLCLFLLNQVLQIIYQKSRYAGKMSGYRKIKSMFKR